MKDKVQTILQKALDDLTLLVLEEQKKQKNQDMLETYFLLRRSLLMNKINEINLRSHMKDRLSRADFLREFGTLRLDFGRQTGNSYFIKQLDSRIVQQEKKPTVCTIFRKVCYMKYQQLKHIKSFTIQEVFNNPRFHSEPLNLGDYQTVILDNSMMYTTEELNEIYGMCASGTTELIILT
jgi:hypothetical protein